jgi:peroxiredoxin
MHSSEPATVAPRVARGFCASRNLFAAFACALALSASASTPAKLIGQPAPEFVLRALNDNNLRLSEHLGEVVLINFWASWCGPCKQEMPKLDELNDKYHRAGLVLVGINIDEDPHKAVEMANAIKVSYPLLMDDRKDVARAYFVASLPATIIVDREGVVRYVNEGYKAGTEKQYQEELRKLLNQQ